MAPTPSPPRRDFVSALRLSDMRGDSSVAKLNPSKEAISGPNGPNLQKVLEDPFKTSLSWIFVSPVAKPPTDAQRSSESSRSPLGFIGFEFLAAKYAYDLLDSGVRGSFKCFFSAIADRDTEAARSGDVVGEFKFVNNSLSGAYFKHVRNWLEDGKGHPGCSSTLSGAEKINSTTAPLPRRCIRLSYPVDYKIVATAEDRPHINLVLVETEGLTGSYVCLSHRWVQPQTSMTSTTKTNYHERLSGKYLDNLPTLFHDVFHAAAALNIYYVWIDSLCIVQDDARDWKQESVRMSDYYQRAAFTISTTSDQTSGRGLFRIDAPPLAQLPYLDKDGTQNGSFYLSPEPQNGAWAQRYSDLVRESELLSRGWVVQEWLLSRRLVCFTEHGIFLQCRCPGKEASSISPAGLVTYHPTLFGDPELAIKSSLSVDLSSSDAIRRSWEEVVSQYSRRGLTQPRKDRILALTGIASEFTVALKKTTAAHAMEKEQPEQEQIAGLLHDDILRGLLWEQTSCKRHKRIPDFPTWSWASIYTGVIYQRLQRGTISTYECIIADITRVKKNQLFSNNNHASGGPRQLPLFAPSTPATPSTDQTYTGTDAEGDIDNFAVIHLKARLIPVHILRRYLFNSSSPPSDEDVYVCTDASGHTSRESRFTCTTQRAVVMPGKPGLAAGWASLEHPDFQVSGDDGAGEGRGEERMGVMVFALVIQRVGNISPGSLGLGYVGLLGMHSHDSFEVVFVTRHREIVDGFERVGRGSIFGREAMKAFEQSVERDLWLI
ncbi:hypothetical protein OQA88_11838 [Cercophora sp. LCS_1]